MESAERAWKLPKLSILFTIAVTSACLPIVASADCTDSKVKRLSRQGKTTATIAATCGMDAEDIREILAEGSGGGDSTPTTDERTGLSPGAPLAPCGCWGPVPSGYREPNQEIGRASCRERV